MKAAEYLDCTAFPARTSFDEFVFEGFPLPEAEYEARQAYDG